MNKIKALVEKRNALIEDMKQCVSAAAEQTRALTDEEKAQYEDLKNQVDALAETIKLFTEAEDVQADKPVEDKPVVDDKSTENEETRAFANYVRARATGVEQTRSDVNITTGDNGAILPKTIANHIIDKIKEISPIYELAAKYTAKGTLAIPYYDATSHSINVAYGTEFSDPAASAGSFMSVNLTGYLAAAVSKISKSLINNAEFDIVNFIINEMAKDFAVWLEGECLKGTSDKITGLSTATNVVTATSATAVTADELIDVQEKVTDRYATNGIWIMSRATRTAIRKLKDGDGNYLLQKDSTAKWGYSLYGNPVYVSENCADMAASAKAVYFVNPAEALAVKSAGDVEINVLREKYAEQHAIGITGWMEVDAKVVNQQAVAVLQMAAA